jgi:hypothetical protein
MQNGGFTAPGMKYIQKALGPEYSYFTKTIF